MLKAEKNWNNNNNNNNSRDKLKVNQEAVHGMLELGAFKKQGINNLFDVYKTAAEQWFYSPPFVPVSKVTRTDSSVHFFLHIATITRYLWLISQ